MDAVQYVREQKERVCKDLELLGIILQEGWVFAGPTPTYFKDDQFCMGMWLMYDGEGKSPPPPTQKELYYREWQSGGTEACLVFPFHYEENGSEHLSEEQKQAVERLHSYSMKVFEMGRPYGLRKKGV